MSIIICFTVSLFLMYRVQHLDGLPVYHPINVLQSTILSTFVSYAISELVPLVDWGMKLVKALHIKSRILGHVILSVVLGTGFAFMILFVCAIINNMVASGISGSWSFFIFHFLRGVWPIVIGLVLVFLIPVQMLSIKISGFDPEAEPAAA
ncbi:MAG: hypothetical protein FWD80_07470 [Propionibacteriaceae bacterium]|nr:hypothetical protein [Propionibacteriaceae bacterium]